MARKALDQAYTGGRRRPASPMQSPAIDAEGKLQEPPADLDDPQTQDAILFPETIKLGITVDDKSRTILVAQELTLADRKRVLRHLSSFTMLYRQELVNRVGAERMTAGFLTDPKNGPYISSALLEPAVRDKAIQILAQLATFEDFVELSSEQLAELLKAGLPPPRRSPTLDELDDGLDDGDYIAAAFALLNIARSEGERQRKNSTGAAPASAR